jgi:hypothetical protein
VDGEVESRNGARSATAAATRPMDDGIARRVETYLAGSSMAPLFVVGDSRTVLSKIPDQAVDFCMTSPPYWGHRQYDESGIGLESRYVEYIDNLLAVITEVHRILKDTGSFWLNIGDAYRGKSLVGLPWRVALRMLDEQGWMMRNNVVWHKVKGGPDNSRDKLRNVHENLFHFVKTDRAYYDIDAIRIRPREAKIVNGAKVSATGVTGVRYKRQIELSTALSDNEKIVYGSFG